MGEGSWLMGVGEFIGCTISTSEPQSIVITAASVFDPCTLIEVIRLGIVAFSRCTLVEVITLVKGISSGILTFPWA